MSRLQTLAVLAAVAVVACSPSPQRRAPLVYPTAPTVEVVDDYHGTPMADPYRWLEDPDSPETRAWVEAQIRVTDQYLASIPGRERIRQRLTELWNYERYGVPFTAGGRYFYSRNDGLQPQSVLYVAEALDAEPRVLLDPNRLSEDGTVALVFTEVSPDGRWLAYGTSAAGSDWQEWKVRDVASGQDIADHLRWIKFSEARWTRDSGGFYYARYEEPSQGNEMEELNQGNKVYLHRLGTTQAGDELVYQRPDHPDWFLEPTTSEDGRYLILTVAQGSANENMVFYRDLEAGGEVVELIAAFDASYTFLTSDGPLLYFLTDQAAPRGRIVAIDTGSPDRGSWQEIVPEQGQILEAASVVHDTIIARYLKDARAEVALFALDGAARGGLELPGLGSVSGFEGRRDDRETFYAYSSFTNPTTIYHLDLATGASTVFRKPEVGFDPADFVVEQAFYESKDGTRVPIFVTHLKDLLRDGRNPTILYGYGGFKASMTPRFSVPDLVWMEMGGVYAQACLRGGGEYGQEWHDAGRLKNKQNVFDDFIAAAEWLVAEGYTSPTKLSISGASNGGLLVGAVVNQRPDLFAAAVPAVGVMDMLRFHKFTIGWAWVSDYGSPDDPEMFPVLRAYSPLHNLVAGTHYPATMIITADHDDRVVPAHSFKYVAALQTAQGGPAPVLIRIETRAGHGGGKPVTKQIEEAADRIAFLTRELGMEGW